MVVKSKELQETLQLLIKNNNYEDFAGLLKSIENEISSMTLPQRKIYLANLFNYAVLHLKGRTLLKYTNLIKSLDR